MLASAPIAQFYSWAAWYELHGPQDGLRLDIAADRIVASVMNVLRSSNFVPLKWWDTPRNRREMSDDEIADQCKMMAEVQELRALNLERAAELRAKRG